MVLSAISNEVGPYRLVEEIGRGGSAVVFRALQQDTGREVAIKLMADVSSSPQRFRQRFYREVSIARELDHPNILPLLDFGEHQGMFYLVMPYVPKGTLADLLNRGAILSPQQAVFVLKQIAGALDYAHSRAIIHRDIKPHNILILSTRQVCLSDFGISRLIDDSTRLTMNEAVLGSPSYMSPEQARSARVDHRSDIYSLGTVLYECLLGRLPYSSGTALEALYQRLNTAPLPPREINPLFPVSLERVLLRALNNDPNKRFQSAGALVDSLQQVVEALPHHLQVQRLVTPDQVSRSMSLVNPPLQGFRPARRAIRILNLKWAAVIAIAALLLGLSSFYLESLFTGNLDSLTQGGPQWSESAATALPQPPSRATRMPDGNRPPEQAGQTPEPSVLPTPSPALTVGGSPTPAPADPGK